MMKKINFLFVLSVSTVLFLSQFTAKAQSAADGIYYEPFDYAVSLTNGINVQGSDWWYGSVNNLNVSRNTTGDPVLVTSGNLTYPGMESSGNKISITGTSTMYDRRVKSHVNHRVYSSFIFNVTALPNVGSPADGDRFVSFGNNSNDFGLVHLRRSTTVGKFNIGLRKRDTGTITWLNKDLDINTNYFLVLGARHTGTIAGSGNYIGDCVAELWLNPTGISNEDTPDISATDGANLNDFRTVQWVLILNNTGKNIGLKMDIDELRSSTNGWSEVVPFAGGTGNRTIITDGSLNYTGINSSGNKVSFSGAGGGYYTDFSGQSSTGALYSSFILNLSSLPVIQDYFIYLGNENDKVATIWLKPSITAGKFNIGVGKRHLLPVTWSTTDLDLNKSYYIASAYKEESGNGNDIAKLWINPASFATEPSPNISTANGPDIDNVGVLNRVVLDRGNAGLVNASLNVDLDELKVSSTWLNLTTLPVRFESLTAEAQENRSKISWVVLSEDNNDYFEVQRSTDGKVFEKIAEVKGKGTTNEKTEYTAYDYNPINGNNYYRLIQVDRDGAKIELGTRVLSYKFDPKIKFSVYPNPATSDINLLVSNYTGGQVDVELTSVHGNVLYKERINTVAEQSSYPIKLANKPAPGIYLLNISSSNGLKESLKIIVQ